MNADDGNDFWPTFTLTPMQFERCVAEIVQSMAHEVTDWQVNHLAKVKGKEGTYIIDVLVRFRVVGMQFTVLFECKRHATRIKRDDVIALHGKVQSTGAHKGVLVAGSGFQSGALQYAREHGIACVRLVDEAWTYEIRMGLPEYQPAPTGQYVAYAMHWTARGFARHMLTGDGAYAAELLLTESVDE
jgi:restriction system protein